MESSSSSNSATIINQSFDEFYSHHARESLDELSDYFTITDPSISGHPIVFASHAFLKMTGFTRDEVVGRSGGMFQGPATCRRSVMEIREAVREERECDVVLVNYRKDGTPFWVLISVCPVFSKRGGAVVHFVAVQVPLHRKRTRVCYSDGFSHQVHHDFVFRCCRKEVCADSLAELGRVSSSGNQVLEHDVTELESEEPREASDVERRSAVTAMDNIFSVLTHYSELTGRLVSRKRCGIPDVGLLSSSLIISLGRIKQSFVLTNPHLPDMPIVYASDAFTKLTEQTIGTSYESHGLYYFCLPSVVCTTTLNHRRPNLNKLKLMKMVLSSLISSLWSESSQLNNNARSTFPSQGYARNEVLGSNCRFLGGRNTDHSALHLIRESIKNEQPCTVRILNYRKDKSSFWNLLHISPVRNASGKVAYFVGVQIEDDYKNDEYRQCWRPDTRQLSVVGVVKVAVRSLSMSAGSSKT